MNKKLEMNKSEAIKYYNSSTDNGFKKLLEDTFGKDFHKVFLIDKIKTYKDVCIELDEEEITEEHFKSIPKEYRKKLAATAKIKQIERLFNQGWIPDWYNQNEHKYYPWFKYESHGLVFNYSFYCSYCSYFEVGFYKSKEISDYVGKTFIKIYNDLA